MRARAHTHTRIIFVVVGRDVLARHIVIRQWPSNYRQRWINAPEACNGLKMRFVWAVGLTILFIACTTTTVSSFNLEVRYPVIKVGRAQAYFGYSVAQHRTLRTREFGEAVILVGAPKDNNLQPNTSESGALWRCPLSTGWQVSDLSTCHFFFVKPLFCTFYITYVYLLTDATGFAGLHPSRC